MNVSDIMWVSLQLVAFFFSNVSPVFVWINCMHWLWDQLVGQFCEFLQSISFWVLLTIFDFCFGCFSWIWCPVFFRWLVCIFLKGFLYLVIIINGVHGDSGILVAPSKDSERFVPSKIGCCLLFSIIQKGWRHEPICYLEVHNPSTNQSTIQQN